MKRKLLLFITLVCVSLTPCYGIPSKAAMVTKITPAPYFNYLSRVMAGLSISSSGVASCSGGLYIFKDGYDTKIKMVLQKLKNGSWNTVTSWSQSNTDSGTYLIGKNYVVDGSGTYRVKVTVSVYSNTGKLLESSDCNSDEVTY